MPPEANTVVPHILGSQLQHHLHTHLFVGWNC